MFPGLQNLGGSSAGEHSAGSVPVGTWGAGRREKRSS